MPNGVICGGAVDGSNQLGASVTCHAITASPGWAAPAGFTASASSSAVTSEAIRSRWRLIRSPLRSAHVFVVILEGHVDQGLPAGDLLAHRPCERSHPEHHAAVVVVELLGQALRHPRALVRVELARDRIDVLVVRSVGQQVESALGVKGALPGQYGLVERRRAV